ncbi:hypothetical protein SAMN02745121_01935 [Nannocystis exedens]|uniref:Uncharacterized protein n=1 Tax=Nannocystis exedens TaxID=54 RepID=A0A1I1VZR1_9BACT|nr:hypothetical protein [Nannocystis exedens]PCC72817.1 hypothetical protein NAEX_05902 [Nannocystis exedens]SFD86100.1 hypothetical protein SAMN02745121_01935 [Nannocystis exedens]
MTDSGDIWQRYDAKVLQIQQLEARVAELEGAVATGRHERDHWAQLARQLNKKLQVAAGLAQRLRAAQHEPQAPLPSVIVASPQSGASQEEFDRAREVLGLVLSALTRALDDDDEAVAELGRRLRHHAGGKLLHSITRGTLTLVPVDGRYLVDRAWLERLDLTALRGELDVAAQSGIYPRPAGSSIVHTEPPIRRPDLQARLAELGPSPASPAPASRPAPIAISGELEIELEHEEYDAYTDLPPPPPMPAAQLLMPPPPLLAALPAEDVLPPPPPPTEPPRRLEDTMRGKIQTPAALTEAFIPNLRIGRLVKTPSGG